VTSDWLNLLRQGDRATLARAITAVENDTAEAPAIYAAIYPHLSKAHVVGFTGPPGAGKSTLVGAYIGELRRRGLSVGVVAVDPSSPLSGGAILGDRVRMTGHAGDDGVFVRSLASRGHLGGLSRSAARVVDVMDAAGKDVVVIETVGAGQSEVEVAEVAHTKVVVCAPGLGDDIQAIKAGILEIADILVVNKADLPLAARTAKQLSAMLGLTRHAGWTPPVLRTEATNGAGVPELADAIASHHKQHGDGGRASPIRRIRRLLAGAAGESLQAWISEAANPEMDQICEKLLKGDLGFEQATRKALEILARAPKNP
jgi:LAO/AO transport system kinase